MDGMPAAELTSRKKVLVQQLNDFIAKKKEHGNDIAGRKELIGAAKRGDIPKDTNSEGSHDRLYDLHHSLGLFQRQWVQQTDLLSLTYTKVLRT